MEIDAAVLRANIAALDAALSPRTSIIFVVKANAYGHGLAPVARCAWDSGVRWFAVAHLDEALALRALLPRAEILLLSALDPSRAGEARACNAVAVVVSRRHALALARAAGPAGLRCHAKIDTGMGRLGLPWQAAAEDVAEMSREGALRVEGLCTHFASADVPDRGFTEVQAERFAGVVSASRARGVPVNFRHVSNSGGILANPAWDMEGVRPGIMLYGYGHGPPGSGRKIDCRPFLQWKTRVVLVKDVPAGFRVSYGSTCVTQQPTALATIEAGYADGVPRQLSNRGAFLAAGRRCPLAGRVTMNLTILDVGQHGDVREGDEVVMLGTQAGASLGADELAAWADTIPHEILTGIRTADRRAPAA